MAKVPKSWKTFDLPTPTAEEWREMLDTVIAAKNDIVKTVLQQLEASGILYDGSEERGRLSEYMRGRTNSALRNARLPFRLKPDPATMGGPMHTRGYRLYRITKPGH